MFPTEQKTSSSLLLPDSLIPSDVTFEIQDLAGVKLGEVAGGHRKIMAIKSSTFRAMFYGPLKDNSQKVVIKDTTKIAFQHMLRYIHDLCEDWSGVPMRELFALVVG